MSQRLVIFLIISFSSAAWAAGTPEEIIDTYRYRIEKTLYDVKTVQPDCPACGLFTAGEGKKFSPSCQKTYKDFYKVKNKISEDDPRDNEIDIRLAFGYMDSLRDVDDYYAGIAFASQVTAKCYRGQFACGFNQDPDDSSTFRKRIRLMGPDGVPRERIVKLRIRTSSASNDERLNRGERKADQDKKTEKTRKFFYDGLQNADMVMYVGHARDGGGPDFGPPTLNAKTNRTDYDWYHKNHPGVNLMHEALSTAKKKPKILGLFSCYAQDHFYNQLRKDAPDTGLILSGYNEFQAAVGQAAAALDSVLGLRCEEDFLASANVIKNIPVQDMPNGFDVGPVQINGVFK